MDALIMYSRHSYLIGQRLIKQMGLWAAARFMRNLGISVEDAVGYLATRPRHAN